MRCHGFMSGTDSRFYVSTNPHLFTTKPTPTSYYFRVSYNPKFRKLVSPIRTRVVSLKSKATINDGFVTEASEMMSFYELLGIPESVTLSDIKQAYKQLARKYHPDVSPPGRVEEYTKRFILVQEAYETLSDPRKKALYDRDMARGIHLAFSARKRYQSDEFWYQNRAGPGVFDVGARAPKRGVSMIWKIKASGRIDGKINYRG